MLEQEEISKSEVVATTLGEVKLEEQSPNSMEGDMSNEQQMVSPTQLELKSSRSSSPKSSSTSIRAEDDSIETIGGDIEVKIEPGKAPKLSRKASQKVHSRAPVLFDHLPNSTEEAVSNFQVIRDCIYGSKYMGSSEHDVLGCDCSEQWGKSCSSEVFPFPY